MLKMIQEFPGQMLHLMDMADNYNLSQSDHEINNVLVCGMGGSGIGADFVNKFIQKSCGVPLVVNKSYDIPAFAGKHTLAVVSSYSGNTEETLSAFQKLWNANCKIVVISSGGELMRLAIEHQLDFVKLPGNWNSPRACLGFSMMAQLKTLIHFNLVSTELLNDIRKTIHFLTANQKEIIEKAQQLSSLLKSKMIVCYSPDSLEPVALRFRQQINENSKMLCWHNVIPEMNHNELVGWRWNQPAIAVLFLRNSDDHSTIQARIEITKEIVGHYTHSILEVYSKGDSLIMRSLYLVHLLDFVSYFIAEENNIDAIEVKVIDFLKTELSKLK